MQVDLFQSAANEAKDKLTKDVQTLARLLAKERNQRFVDYLRVKTRSVAQLPAIDLANAHGRQDMQTCETQGNEPASDSTLTGTPSALPPGAFTPSPAPPPLPRPRPAERILVASLAQAEDARAAFDQWAREKCSQKPFEWFLLSVRSMLDGVGFRCAMFPAPWVD